MPTRLLNDAKSHLGGLVRDMALLDEAASARATIEYGLADLAARLKHLATDLIWFRNEIRRQVVEAVERGDAVLTLQLDLPVSLRGRLIEYRDALDEAEQQCAQGRLLVARSTARAGRVPPLEARSHHRAARRRRARRAPVALGLSVHGQTGCTGSSLTSRVSPGGHAEQHDGRAR